jgi:hypothetical protein
MMGARDQIDALVCGYSSRLRAKSGLLMLVGYGDDSGNDPQQCAFIIAGFIANPEKWKNFSDAWDASCLAHDLDPRAFKMAKAERLKGGYWGEGESDDIILAARRDAALRALSAVVVSHADYRFHAVMDWASYKELMPQVTTMETDSPYFFLLWNTMLALAAHTRDGGFPEKVDFVLDDQSKIGLNAILWRDFVLKNMDDQLRQFFGAVPVFRHDSDVLPLKAADMLAWSMLRHLWDKQNDPTIQMRPVLQTLLEVPIAVDGSFSYAEMQRLVIEANSEFTEDHP